MAGKQQIFPNEQGQLWCSTCRTFKNKEQFAKHSRYARGYQYSCKECANSKRQQWRRDNPERTKEVMRRHHRKNLYGLSDRDYMILGLTQDWKCAVCFTDIEDLEGRDLDVDHDHSTGKIRGLLCGSCNKGLGCFKDSIELLELAIKYLKDN